MSVIFIEIFSYSVITSIAIYQIHVVGDEVKQMANAYLPLFTASGEIRRQVQDKQLSLKDIVFVGDRVVYDKKAEETYLAARTRFLEASLAIGDLLENSTELINQPAASRGSDATVIETFRPQLLEQISRIRLAHRLNNGRVETIFKHVEDGSFLMGMELLRSVTQSEERLLEEVGRLESILLALKSASVNYTVGVEKASARMTLLASALTVCIVIALFFFMVRRNLSRPLHLLTDAINSFDVKQMTLMETEEDKRLLARGDELGMVARSFYRLKQDLWTQDKALRESKDAAEKADRAKSHFLAAASHDLRQPLHAMQMYLVALREKLEQKEALDIVGKVENVSITAGRLLNSLLDISQLEAGEVTPQIEDFPVQEMLRRLTLSFAPVAQQKNLELRVVRSKVVVKSDPALLERIVGNYLSNAIRYTEKGTVLLGCRRRGDKIAIQVWDTGIGIPDASLNAVFQEFVQLHNPERDRGKGLGLGLAISHRLAACLGHEIECRSNVGKGSHFGIVVDRGTETNAVQKSTALAKFPTSLDGTNVVFIEDDKIVGQATTELLVSWGCNVRWATSAQTGIEIVTRSDFTPDVILADYRLPGDQDGLQVATALQLAVGRAIPIIIVTGESDLSKISALSDLGYSVLRKPVRPAKLRSLINHHVSSSALGAPDAALKGGASKA